MNHQIWKYDLENRFANETISDIAEGDGFVASAMVTATSEIIAKSSWKMSRWDAYKHLSEILMNDVIVFPRLLTFQIALLDNTDIPVGYPLWNLNTDRLECFNGTTFSTAAGELGGLVHLPASVITTTNNIQTVLNKVALEDDSVYLFTAEIIGENNDHSTVLGIIIECTAKRFSTGPAEIVGNVTTTHSGKDSGAGSWGATFTVLEKDLRVSVTGANGTLVNWEGDLNYLKF